MKAERQQSLEIHMNLFLFISNALCLFNLSELESQKTAIIIPFPSAFQITSKFARFYPCFKKLQLSAVKLCGLCLHLILKISEY